jgi:ABC-type lipoprotein release transport system permease subunit
MALGATHKRILLSVIWSGTGLAIVGVVVGTVAAVGVTRTLQGFVWGVSTLDPMTFGAVAVILTAVAALACLVPAVRAVRLNPVTALRQ